MKAVFALSMMLASGAAFAESHCGLASYGDSIHGYSITEGDTDYLIFDRGAVAVKLSRRQKLTLDDAVASGGEVCVDGLLTTDREGNLYFFKRVKSIK